MFLEEVFSENVSLKSRVEQILESRFSKDISLEEIASELSLSKYTLCRRYFAECGMTVMEQLKRIRVAKAKQLLLSTALPVSEIGKMCGFMSPSYFGKVFKRHYRQHSGCLQGRHKVIELFIGRKLA